MFFDSLQFSFNTTLPIILLMGLGILLRKWQFIDDQFSHNASRIVFNFTLPTLLFLNMQKGELDYFAHIPLILTGVIGTLVIFLFAEWWASRYIEERQFRAVFVQGAFRCNAAILGLGLVINAYGNEAIVEASVYIACLVILFNILAVITLTKSFNQGKTPLVTFAISILKNPLILSIIFGLVVNYLSIRLPKPLLSTAQYMAGMTLPLALICAGASIDFTLLKQFSRQNQESVKNRLVFFAVIIRLIVAPLFLFSLGKWVFQLSPTALGIVFITGSTPVAAATYAMVRNYGGDATSTANLIGVSTLASMFVSTVGLFVLRQLNWI